MKLFIYSILFTISASAFAQSKSENLYPGGKIAEHYKPATFHYADGRTEEAYANVVLKRGESMDYYWLYYAKTKPTQNLTKKELVKMTKDDFTKVIVHYEDGSDDDLSMPNTILLRNEYSTRSVGLYSYPLGLLREAQPWRYYIYNKSAGSKKYEYILMKSPESIQKGIKSSFLAKCPTIKSQLKTWKKFDEEGLKEMIDIYEKNNCGK